MCDASVISALGGCPKSRFVIILVLVITLSALNTVPVSHLSQICGPCLRINWCKICLQTLECVESFGLYLVLDFMTAGLEINSKAKSHTEAPPQSPGNIGDGEWWRRFPGCWVKDSLRAHSQVLIIGHRFWSTSEQGFQWLTWH